MLVSSAIRKFQVANNRTRSPSGYDSYDPIAGTINSSARAFELAKINSGALLTEQRPWSSPYARRA
jgi:hypothetical protein